MTETFHYYDRLRSGLFARRSDVFWEGELSASALSTATALSALSVCYLQAGQWLCEQKEVVGSVIARTAAWLLKEQNSDGGWGDTVRSRSNSSTTLLVKAALILAGRTTLVTPDIKPVIESADRYLTAQGGINGVRRRYGRDKTFIVPILMNCALAGIVGWEKVSPLPFELAAVPSRFYRFLRLPVVSYAIPALVAIGLVRFENLPPRTKLIRFIRHRTIEPVLRVLETMQPASGGYLEATPLTSFVLMSLSATQFNDIPVVQNALRFLLDSVRPDGSFPIDTNLATWLTTLTINAVTADDTLLKEEKLVRYLLDCQHKTEHPFTKAAPGGWAWTHYSGGVPDADDTPGAILALTRMIPFQQGELLAEMKQAILSGIDWLLALANRTGGFPTFCRGWGKLPFDRSSLDLTAHAIRAFLAAERIDGLISPAKHKQLQRATRRGCRFLLAHQQKNGSWLPLWFGNENLPDDINPWYGTAKVLLATAKIVQYAEQNASFLPVNMVSRLRTARTCAVDWIVKSQNNDGGWGYKSEATFQEKTISTMEETAVILESLTVCLPIIDDLQKRSIVQSSLDRGIECLKTMIDNNEQETANPIGLYFTKLWYFERLYPWIFGLAALRDVTDSRTWASNGTAFPR